MQRRTKTLTTFCATGLIVVAAVDMKLIGYDCAGCWFVQSASRAASLRQSSMSMSASLRIERKVMSTHLNLNSDGNRSILEPCEFCESQAGEPCQIVHGRAKGQYECPDDACDQTYERAGDALSCVLHKAWEPSQS